MKQFFLSKNIIVTGAGSGIGRALAEELFHRGANVMMLGRNKESLEKARHEIMSGAGASEGTLLTRICDVSSFKDCEKAAEAAIREFGDLDIVINNAGVSMRGIACASSLDVFQTLTEINYYGVLHFYKATCSVLRESRGSFVAISSMQGRYSTQYRSGYAAAKHAVQGFMDSVRIEEPDMHVLTVSPGFVRTNVAHNALTADGSKKGESDPAIESGLEPEVVARKILKAIQGKKRDAYPAGLKEKTALLLSRLSPRLLDFVLRRVSVT